VRPYVLLSCAMSIDGHIDDNGPERLLLSNAEDFDRVDEVRASCDAIMVGAGTVRRDNPRLLIRSPERRKKRVARGLPPDPVKVTVTARGDLDPESAFFTAGDGEKLVYASAAAAAALAARLNDRATVISTGGAGDAVDLGLVLDDLGRRGVRRLMVEGGGHLHTRFLSERLADELQLVIAPLFVGDPAAPRFVSGGGLPTGRLNLTEAVKIGDVALLRYRLR
jgi:5-amino-6-(5-phosphoribosylamino)uracil reductase